MAHERVPPFHALRAPASPRGDTVNERARQRVFVLRVVVLSLMATLLGRLWYVQVLAGPTYRAAAQSNLVRELVNAAPRGEILDDEGRPLARDRYEYVVTVSDDALSRQKDGGLAVLRRLAPVVGESLATLKDKTRLCGPKVPQPCYTGSPYQPVPIKVFDPADNAGLQRALIVEEKAELFPGVALSEQQVRIYPYGALASHELGYLEPINSVQLAEPRYKGYQPTDLVGVSGLEDQYDQALRGTAAVQQVSVDAAGHVTGTLSQTQPVPGDTLVTNLDAGLQQALDRELQNAIAIGHSQGGLATTATGIVVDVNTGGVLAMASLPNYNPNEFTGGISDAQYAALQNPYASEPLISRAYSAAFPPGSTFKISSSAAILQNGLATPNTSIPCPSGITVGNQVFRNFEGEARGLVNVEQALEYSCDSYYYQFAYNQWVLDGGLRADPAHRVTAPHEYFAQMAKAFGYGSRTGLDLPNETAGVIYDRAQIAQLAAAEKVQDCKGATSHPTDPAREAADKALCDSTSNDRAELQAGEAVDFAIGQAGQVAVTVLQQAMAYAAVANGGTIYEPRLAKAFINAQGTVVQKVAPVVKSHLPVSAANLAAILSGLRLVVTGGTGSGSGFDPQLDVAGKTGTADVAATGVLTHQPESWFASIQPADHPRYVVVVMVEHGGQGAFAAGETVANIYKDIYGLDGHAAVWPHGQPPVSLPRISSTGAIASPQAPLLPVVPSNPLPGGTPDPVAVQNELVAQAALRAAAAQKATGSKS